MRGRRGAVAVAGALCAVGVGACGGGERQDAGEKAGTYKVEITDASFPAKQFIADAATMRISVRNVDDKTLPEVSVTVATQPGESGGAAQAFSTDIADPDVSDPSRPIWIVDQGPVGGDTSYTNTWSLGPLKAGQSKDFKWNVTAVRAGDYTIHYSVSPGLTGKAKVASGPTTQGTFKVKVDDSPPKARVGADGQVIRERDDAPGR